MSSHQRRSRRRRDARRRGIGLCSPVQRALASPPIWSDAAVEAAESAESADIAIQDAPFLTVGVGAVWTGAVTPALPAATYRVTFASLAVMTQGPIRFLQP